MTKLRRAVTVLIGLIFVTLQGCATLPSSRNSEDLPHFSRVDEQLARGGQPTAEGFRQLAKTGVRTVVDLRAEHIGGKEKEVVESLGMRSVHLPVLPGGRPSDKQVFAFLELVQDPQRRPVFVHCQRGKFRTGILVAIYRIAVLGWPPEKAYAEAQSLGMAVSPESRRLILEEAKQKFSQQKR